MWFSNENKEGEFLEKGCKEVDYLRVGGKDLEDRFYLYGEMTLG